MPKTKDKKIEFGQRLRKLRRARGLTQVQLAARLGITQVAISDYERGRSGPSPQLIVKLAQIIGVTTDELLGTKQRSRPPEMSVGTMRLWSRFKKLQSLPTRDRQTIWRLIDTFVRDRGSDEE